MAVLTRSALESSPLADLHEIASELGIDGFRRLRKAALVLMHTRAAPKSKVLDPDLYDDVVEDVIGFLRERMDVAASRGVSEAQILVDPGPDFAKTPAQTLEVLARLEELHVLERPILLAIS